MRFKSRDRFRFWSSSSVLSIICTALLAVPCSAGKKSGGSGAGKPPTNASATSVVLDSDFAGVPYRIHSDYARTGTNTYYDNVDSVVSQVPDYYELSTWSSMVRTMFVDLSHPVDASTVLDPAILGGATSGFAAGRFIGKFGGLAAMTGVGSQLTGGMPFVFIGYDGVKYQVRMNSSNEPGTEDATFTCTHVQGSDQTSVAALCDGWTATPAANSRNDGSSIGRLARVQTYHGHDVLTYLGDYYMTFHLEITRP